jgi:nucleotide-binding universal stress UspA family protein
MIRSILVALDGSPFSQSALELGIRWASKHDALLVGQGVIDEPTIRESEPVPLGADTFKGHLDDVRMQRARTRVETFLGQFTIRCAEAGVSAKVLEDVGLPYEQILLAAQRYDLLLLGQQTYFHFATQSRPDETLRRVLGQTPRPVVTVPEKLGDGSAVVVAYDGSLQAARALYAFQASGLGAGQVVHLVSVAARHADAARAADRAADFLGLHQQPVEIHAIASSAAPAEVLLGEVQRLHSGLLVMGAYGQPALKEFFLGSVTRTLLQTSPVPLFLFH